MGCALCGNVVGFIKDTGKELICCGQPMTEIKPNSVDASHEKHVPVAVVEGGKIKVKIGSVPHPMLPEHYIEWIAVITENGTERISLAPGMAPEAEFCFKENAEVYAYCNLHGLWKVAM